MNPLSLLNKGQTINGFKGRAVSYKLPSRSYLPNFSNTKPTPPTSSPVPQELQASREIVQPTFFDIPKPSVPAPRPAAPTPKPPAAPPAPAPREPMWNQFVAICRDFFNKWTTERNTSPFQKRTVQTELALEKITVVRNDLSEEDVEVIRVPKKEKRAKAESPTPVGGATEHEQCQVSSTDR
ncbi:MAG TPA: hypothetical protein VHZ30_02575 [Verrucomicrobiae bacterium]|jgi:hypothetical protein|nr:hypothetical protein [Verrucomicrobiae bacterium]